MLFYMKAEKIFYKGSNQEKNRIFKDLNTEHSLQNYSIEPKQNLLNPLNGNRKMSINGNDLNSSQINEITKKFFGNKTLPNDNESNELSFLFDFSSFNLSEMEGNKKKFLFAIILSILTILGCCGLLQVMIWLTKDCRINLNEINAREKKIRFLNGKKEEKNFR